MTEAQDWLKFAVGISAVVTAVGGAWLKWGLPRYRDWRFQFIAARDSIIGRPAVIDTITGEERVPALPGVGMRLATTEEHLGTLTALVGELVRERADVRALDRRVKVVEGDVAVLKAASVERIVGRAESAEAWRTMAEAIKATPDEIVEAEDV